MDAIGLQVDRDVLHGQVLVDSLVAALTAESRFLYPTERRGRIAHQALVESEHADLESLGHPQRALQVAGEHIGNETELAVVGRGYGFILAAERLDWRHRSEDLLAQQGRVIADAGQHSRGVEVPAVADLLAAGEPLRPLTYGVLDELGHFAPLVVVDERPHLHTLSGAAPALHLAELRRQPLRELLSDRLVHVEAVRRDAG